MKNWHACAVVLWMFCPPKSSSRSRVTENYQLSHSKGAFDLKQLLQNDHRMTSKYRESYKKAVGSYAFKSLSRYFYVIRWSSVQRRLKWNAPKITAREIPSRDSPN